MSLSNLASRGSFVSGVAVAVTLIFTLLQLRQNNRNLRATMQQVRTGRYSEQLLRPTEPFLCEAVTMAMEGKVDMSSEQVIAFTRHATSVIWNSEDVFMQHRAGNLDQDSFDSDMAILKAYLSSPAYRVGWWMSRGSANIAFRDFIDGVIRETRPLQPSIWSEVWKRLMAQELKAANARPTLSTT
jgi:hypothetical protein